MESHGAQQILRPQPGLVGPAASVDANSDQDVAWTHKATNLFAKNVGETFVVGEGAEQLDAGLRPSPFDRDQVPTCGIRSK